MPRPTKFRINLTAAEELELDKLYRGHSTPQLMARRAKIVLMANGDAKSNIEIAGKLGVNKAKVTLWTCRWIDRWDVSVAERLRDLPRPGAPDTITPEQWCRIIALACEPPEDHGRPITHWSGKELADEVIKQRIVERISASHLCKMLKKTACNRIATDTGSTPKPIRVRTNGSGTFHDSTRKRGSVVTN